MSLPILLINTDVCPTAKVYPVGLDYLTSYLKDHGYSVDTLDLAFIQRNIWKNTLETLLSKEYIAIGIGIRNLYDEIYNGRNYVPEIIDLIRFIKNEIKNRNHQTKIILGGSGTSLLANTFLDQSGADFAVLHEGEEALHILLDEISSGRNIKQRIWSHPTDISTIYYTRGSWGNFHGYFKEQASGNLQTKRGCQMQCLYCEYPAIEGKMQRFRNPNIIAEEFIQLEKLGFPRMYFVDATFNNPRDQSKRILEALKKAGTKKQWLAFLNPRLLDAEFLELALATHISLPIKITIESGSDTMLRTLQKSFRREHIEAAVDLCHSLEIPFSFSLLLGGPGETKATVRETCDLIIRSQPEYVTMNIGIYLHPQTPIAALNKGTLWNTQSDFISPKIFPCDRNTIKKWVNDEMVGSGIPWNIYEGGE